MVFVVLCPGAPEDSLAVALILKRLRRRGHGLKSHPSDWEKQAEMCFVAVFFGCTSTGQVGLCFLWFYVQELPKAQPAVVLVFKSLGFTKLFDVFKSCTTWLCIIKLIKVYGLLPPATLHTFWRNIQFNCLSTINFNKKIS